MVVKEVKQGCGLFPVLFNLYIEQALKESKDKEKFGEGTEVQGVEIKTLQFDDDCNSERDNKGPTKPIEWNQQCFERRI